MKIKTIADLAKLYKNKKQDLDIIDALDDDPDLFELHCYIYRKASVHNKVYHTRDLDKIPHEDRKKYKLEIITSGANAEGFDCVEIGERSIAYECKCYEEQNIDKGLSMKEINNKLVVFNNTNLDQLVFITNKRKTSYKAKRYAPNVGYIYRDEIYCSDTIALVREYLATKKKKKYYPITPRDSFFVSAINECCNDLDPLVANIKKKNKNWPNRIGRTERLKVFQHWPASSGKGSLPRLVYDKYLEKLWDFDKSYPINVIVSPQTPVLMTNAIKQIEHDLACKNNNKHIVFNDIVKNLSMEDYDNYSHLLDYARDETQFTKLMLKYSKNSTVTVHVLNSSYLKMARFLKALKKEIFFMHIDEVHHNIQPEDSAWRAPLDEDLINVAFDFRTSANIRIAKGKGAKESMERDEFYDVKLKELSEKKAVDLGYKRQTKQLVYKYDLDNYPHNWRIELDKGKMPIIKFGKSIVPLHWAEQLDANIRASLEHNVKYIKYTFNQIDDIKYFGDVYQDLKSDILKSIARQGLISPSSNEYRKLLARKFYVADTKSHFTTKIIKQIEALPIEHPDGADFGHCLLFGEGWDPKNGWVDASCFMDPTHSELRIYQDVNRGARGPHIKPYNHLIVTQHKLWGVDEESFRNEMFRKVIDTGEKLQHGFEDIRDSVIYHTVQRIPGKPGSKERGKKYYTPLDESDVDPITEAFANYVAYGKNFKFFQVNDMIVDEYYKGLSTVGHWAPGHRDFSKKLRGKIIQKHPQAFESYKDKDLQLRRMIYGHSPMNSPEKRVEILRKREEIAQINHTQKNEVIDIIRRHIKKQFSPSPNMQTHQQEVLNLPYIKACPKFFDLKRDLNVLTGHLGIVVKDIYKEFEKIYPKTQRKVCEKIVEYVAGLKNKNDYKRNLNQLCGYEMGDKKQGIYYLKNKSVLVDYVFAETGIKLTASTMRGLISNNKMLYGKKKTWARYTSAERKILREYDAKAKELQKSTGYGLLNEDELLITPQGTYKPDEIHLAIKDNKIKTYRPNQNKKQNLGRYIGMMIAKGEWSLSTGRILHQGKTYKTTPKKKVV